MVSHPDGSRFGLFAGHTNQFLAGFRHHTWQQGHTKTRSGGGELTVKIPGQQIERAIPGKFLQPALLRDMRQRFIESDETP